MSLQFRNLLHLQVDERLLVLSNLVRGLLHVLHFLILALHLQKFLPVVLSLLGELLDLAFVLLELLLMGSLLRAKLVLQDTDLSVEILLHLFALALDLRRLGRRQVHYSIPLQWESRG